MKNTIRRLHELEDEGYTGTVTLTFHKGALSKKIKLEFVENTALVENFGIDRQPNLERKKASQNLSAWNQIRLD